MYFFLHESWIWRILGHVTNIFLIGIFISLQKNTFGQKISNFMHRFKGAILAIFQFFQNGSAKSRIHAGKSTKRGFSKKAIARINFLFCFVLGSYESLEGLEH